MLIQAIEHPAHRAEVSITLPLDINAVVTMLAANMATIALPRSMHHSLFLARLSTYNPGLTPCPGHGVKCLSFRFR